MVVFIVPWLHLDNVNQRNQQQQHNRNAIHLWMFFLVRLDASSASSSRCSPLSAPLQVSFPVWLIALVSELLALGFDQQSHVQIHLVQLLQVLLYVFSVSCRSQNSLNVSRSWTVARRPRTWLLISCSWVPSAERFPPLLHECMENH